MGGARVYIMHIISSIWQLQLHHLRRMTFVPDRRSAGYKGHSCGDILLRHKTVHVMRVVESGIGFPDFRMDFWISQWISGFQLGFLDFWISVWISADGVRDFFRDGPLGHYREDQPELAVRRLLDAADAFLLRLGVLR